MPVPLGRILVVDDDPDLRRTIVSLLAEEGYKVVEAVHGADALAILREDARFNLVLFDLVMPEMDGWVFQRALAADPELSAIPAVAMSTYMAIGEHAPPPAAAFLQKPFKLTELSGIIKNCARSISK